MSTPCTEGTGSFCRVPSRGFSRTPSDARLAHLCRIAVRADGSSASGLFVAGMSTDFRIEVPSPLRDGGVYHPDPPRPGVLPASTFTVGWRNINRLPIGYALGPRLRSRLTLGGLTFPRKPCAFGGRASHPSCRYSFRHTHSPALHRSLPVRLRRGRRRSPTTRLISIRDCGATLESPSFSARDGSTGKLLRTFEMVAASKPTSRLSPRSHFLCH